MTIVFQPLTNDGLPVLYDWLSRPHVVESWGAPPTLTEVAEHYSPDALGKSGVQAYIAFANGTPIGYIQSYVAMGSGDGWWEDERDPGVRGIDQFLADAELLGQGFGTAMVRDFVAMLFADPAVTRVQTDPAPGNQRAIRCYEKAGFRAVNEVDTPDGRALLMLCERAEAT